ncbi:MAG TPA: FAD/NAD(P)-binding oxidoreductase [Ferruginibacter sp.]|nr:FAD/NAD(P)-binding oxidoreductase [Ferruginibacter sp.]HRO17549.1 FAD/NAD(P)-binding oxidoreductase [Ferruginibacter sp.]HRQ20696.1 FAD/NAD(P)-binding oxidoreductase [Ferruginibacter sp.]
MKPHYQVLIIGGGTAGIMVAAQLKRKDKHISVGIIEPSPDHWYQAAYTLVGAGTFDFKKTRRDTASLIPRGVDWIQDYATTILPNEHQVGTKNAGKIQYDYLVVAPGLVMDYAAMPGLQDALKTDIVCSNYTDPQKTWKVLQAFKGGNALFTQPSTPIKCGGAPQKILYLADDYFRKSGVRNRTNMIYATPGTVIFGTKEFADTLMQVINRKEIVLKLFYNPVQVDAEKRIVYYEYKKDTPWVPTENIHEIMGSDHLIQMPYDMLHLAPPQAAPEFIRQSVLAIPDGAGKGWVDVDPGTLEHQRFPNVYALGDVASLPTAKTGAAVRKQAPVVVDHIIQSIQSKKSHATYSGYSSCPLVTGYGKMLLAEFKYGNVRDSDPFLSKFVDTTKEQWSMWLLKKYGLPYLYWNQMMKGKM